MHTPAHDTPPATLTRLAGALYLVIIVLGVTSEGIIRAPILSGADPAATAAAIAAALPLFRLSMLGDLVMALADVGLAVAFYLIFAPVNRAVALAATAFRLVQTAVIAGGLVLLVAAARSAGAGQADLAHLFAGLHGTGYDIGLMFFGVNSLLLAWLILRAGWLHRVFGWALGAAGVVYLGGSTLVLVAPEAAASFVPAYLVPLLAETALCLRLLFGGRQTR